jgi:PAS domain S-box-containing protein
MKTITNNPRPARSLTATLAIAFFGLSVVTLLVSGSFALYNNIRSLRDSIASSQLLIAQDAGKTVGNFIQDKFIALEAAVEMVNPVSASVDVRKTTLESLFSLHPAFRQIALLDKEGRQLAQASHIAPDLSPQFALQLKGDAITQTAQGQRYISPVYIDDQTSEPLTAIAIPVTDIFGDIQGTLIAEIDLKFMWDLVDRLKVGETGYVYVVDNEGNLIAFGDTARVLSGENVKQISEVKAFIGNPASADDITVDVNSYTGLLGEKVVGTYDPLGTPQWAVVTELPYREAYQPVFQAVAVSIATLLVIAFLAGLVGVLVARRLSAPLINLSNFATEVGSGNLSSQAEVAGPAEIAKVAATFNTMTAQLRDLIGSLEQRVAERTKALATSAEVSRSLTAILDPRQLTNEVVKQIQTAFNYYYAQIYLFDDAGENLVLTAGTGEAGVEMLKRGHALAKGRGLVGRAAKTNQPVLVSDTSQDPNWLPNELLPETKAEAVVPIAIGDMVLGVLDVQDNVSNDISPDDLTLLQSLASQVAIALQNARQYTETQAVLHELGETQSFLDSVIENLPTMLFVKNAGDLRFMRWNKAAEELSGFQREDLIGKNDYDFFPKEEADFFTGKDRQVLANGQLLDIPEEPLATAHQGMRYLHTRKVPIYGTDGIVKYLLGVSEDITERKRNEELTRQHAQQQETINLITQRIQSATTIEDALQVAARELGRALGKRQTLVSLEPFALSGSTKTIINE